MKGYRFSKFSEQQDGQTPFQKLLKLFLQLLNFTAGDVYESLNWMNELDREYKLTNDEYTMADFIKDLKDKGYIREESKDGQLSLTLKSEQALRKSALEEVFGKLKRAKKGNHSTRFTGQGDELTSDHRE